MLIVRKVGLLCVNRKGIVVVKMTVRLAYFRGMAVVVVVVDSLSWPFLYRNLSIEVNGSSEYGIFFLFFRLMVVVRKVG